MWGSKRSRELVKRLRSEKRAATKLVGWFSSNPLMLESSLNRWLADVHEISNELREELGVAKKKYENTDWNGFIDCKLTDEDRAALEAWDVHDGDLWDAIATYGERGYKLSVSYQKQQDSWVAACTGTEHAGKNAGWAVSAYGPTPYDAMRTLYFKLAVVLPDNWTDFKPSKSQLIG